MALMALQSGSETAESDDKGMSDELVEHYKKLADHYNIRRQRAEKKLKEVYEPKLKAGVTYFDEFAFDTKGEPNE